MMNTSKKTTRAHPLPSLYQSPQKILNFHAHTFFSPLLQQQQLHYSTSPSRSPDYFWPNKTAKTYPNRVAIKIVSNGKHVLGEYHAKVRSFILGE
jgi:hypothetical protein